ncbi:MAG: enoyl-CoA hydratase/isomerase family protein [Deltaproteobacteria bacterium]|nr:enoyl-CoA hydratase/isomerase family protein [Deltaproteobacteria bacterium]
MAYETIILEKKERIATVTLNRPPMNPLNRRMYEELTQVTGELNADPEVKVVIITGAGEKAFAAGLDVKEVEGKSVAEIRDFWACSRDASERVAAIEKPVIAVINGLALGGALELALCCDLRIASEGARFGQPEITLGIIPGGGATQRLSRLIGTARAKELLFTGDMFDAQTALQLGVVSKVCPADKLMEEVMALASAIAEKPAVALKMIKLAVNHGINMDLHSALVYEGECFVLSYTSEDGREGLRAFVEKRSPVFKDR